MHKNSRHILLESVVTNLINNDNQLVEQTFKTYLISKVKNQLKETAECDKIVFTPDDVKMIKKMIADDNLDGYEIPDDLYQKLFVFAEHKMPYGVMKARTGDPYQWVYDNIDTLAQELSHANNDD